MVGKDYERGGIAKDGAKMVHAVANAQVPRITLVIGGSFGAGNYAQCGKAYDPRFIFAWPSARCAVMGADQATSTLLDITAKSLQRQGHEKDAEDLAELRDKIRSDYDRQTDVRYGAARGWVDAIIDPSRTREILTLALEVATRHADDRPVQFGVFQV
jgi:3-methylcrotonyl-CoA carboxylase beta subunit